MLYFTGDFHGGMEVKAKFKKAPPITENDYLIICGDFGVVWTETEVDLEHEKRWLDFFNNQPFTTLFVDGNHEGFERLNSFPIDLWNGGQVHRISDKVIHLMRGQVFSIDGNKILTMGGATSIDKEMRCRNIDWWEEELPNYKEYSECVRNLDKNNWTVDYVVSHCVPTDILEKINSTFRKDSLTDFFSCLIDNNLKFKKWYAGHYHINKLIEFKERQIQILYNEIKSQNEN